MSDIGKRAKKAGDLHPRVQRRLEPKRARPTPKTHESKPRKRFGFSYEWCWPSGRYGWRRMCEWYKTRAAANQAQQTMERRIADSSGWLRQMYRDIRKETR